ncbi:MAG: hypothetical protein PHR11_05645, partial [Candidatus Omnitrophica bacterium]|nr:hypothetical protein [Candidatus Omnitrophota bacterium]
MRQQRPATKILAIVLSIVFLSTQQGWAYFFADDGGAGGVRDERRDVMPASSGGGWYPPAQAVAPEDLVIPQDGGGDDDPEVPPVYAAFVGPDVPVYNQDFELIGTASEIDQLAAIQEATDGFLAVQATDNPLWVEVVGTEETYYIPTVPVAEAPE